MYAFSYAAPERTREHEYRTARSIYDLTLGPWLVKKEKKEKKKLRKRVHRKKRELLTLMLIMGKRLHFCKKINGVPTKVLVVAQY